MTIVLLVHGGARATDTNFQKMVDACLVGLQAGWRVLVRDGSACDAVAAVLRVLEATPGFNAGIHGARNSDGEAELSAGLMDGNTHRYGALSGIRGFPHPRVLSG